MAKRLAGGQDDVRLLLDAAPGRAAEIAARIRGLAGKVLMLAPDVDVLRVSVPIDRLEDVTRWPDLTALRVDMREVYDTLVRPDTPASVSSSKPSRSPTPYTARDNPYTAEAATESLQFKAAEPTYDGRGVVIGLIEPVDARVPSLTWAVSPRGARIPKFLDYVSLPPADGWQQTTRVWPDTSGRFVFAGRSFVVPLDETSDEWRVARYRMRQPGISPDMTLLWNVRRARVSLCEAEATAFVDGAVLTIPSASAHSAAIGALPHDETHTIRVTVDVPHRTLGLQLGRSEHGTMCASVAAGHSFLNSQAEGVAPGAQLMVVDYSQQTNAPDGIPAIPVQAWLELLRDPRVDIISNSTVFPSGREHIWDDRGFDAELFHRLLFTYPKPFFAGAGNSGPETGDLNEGLIANSDVITVGGYTPAETWRANFGITPTRPFTPAPYSAYGPSEDGGCKPDLLALTGTLSAATLRAELEAVFGSPYVELPPGYAIAAGTSAAAPHAAGHAALLISAAKQAGIPADPARLKVALFSTARFLPGVEARVQGHGLIQVAQAWHALQQLRRTQPPTFVTRAPVRTYYSDQFSTPHVGRGLHERIGWSPGQTGDRTLTITRTSGPPAPVTYTLRWQGDTGAFSSPLNTLTLPLNQPVALPVHISVGKSRAYSAIVDLLDPDTKLVMHSVMCTVIAAEPLTAANAYATRIDGMAPRPGHGFAFVNVPPGTTALRVQLQQQHGQHVTLFAQGPDGEMPRVGVMTDSDGDTRPITWRLPSSNRESYDQTFTQPLPGVWQFWVTHDDGFSPRSYDPSETDPASGSTFTLQVTALGLASTARLDMSSGNLSVEFVNRFSALESATITPIGIGTMRDDDAVMHAGGAPVFYDLDVPEGTSRIEAVVDAADPGDARISLALFRLDPHTPHLVTIVASDVTSSAKKSIVLAHPPPGKYKVCVDAWGDDSPQRLIVRYRDFIYHPLYGRVLVDDEARAFATGESHAAQVSWDVTAWPTNGRRLVAAVGLFGDSYVNMSLTPHDGQTSPVSLGDQIFVIEQPRREPSTHPSTASSTSAGEKTNVPPRP